MSRGQGIAAAPGNRPGLFVRPGGALEFPGVDYGHPFTPPGRNLIIPAGPKGAALAPF